MLPFVWGNKSCSAEGKGKCGGCIVDGEYLPIIRIWWPGRDLNSRRQPFQGLRSGGKLAAPFMLRSSYCRSKAMTSLVFRKIYRVFLRSRNTMYAWIVPRRVTAKYGLAIRDRKEIYAKRKLDTSGAAKGTGRLGIPLANLPATANGHIAELCLARSTG